MLNRHGCPAFLCNVATTCTKINVKINYLSDNLRASGPEEYGVKATSAYVYWTVHHCDS